MRPDPAAVPARVIELHQGDLATVEVGGVHNRISLALVDGVAVGDYVIVHVGFAISKVDEEEARRTFELLEEISELDELEWMKEVAEQSLSVLDSGKHSSPAAPDQAPPAGPS